MPMPLPHLHCKPHGHPSGYHQHHHRQPRAPHTLLPFHESIVDVINDASFAELPCLQRLLETTAIPENYVNIIVAWERKILAMNYHGNQCSCKADEGNQTRLTINPNICARPHKVRRFFILRSEIMNSQRTPQARPGRAED